MIRIVLWDLEFWMVISYLVELCTDLMNGRGDSIGEEL